MSNIGNESKELDPHAIKHIQRRRSPPRIISITDGMGVEHQPRGSRSVIRVTEEKLEQHPPLTPHLIRLIVLREEPTSPTPLSVRTTLMTVDEAKDMRRLVIPRVRPRAGLHLTARMKRVAPSSRISSPLDMVTVRFKASSPIRAPVQLRSKVTKHRLSGNLESDEGVNLAPGTVQIWKISGNRRAAESQDEDRPALEISGSQGVRVSFHSRAGNVIADLEAVAGDESIRLSVPPRTGYFTVWGLGGAGQLPSQIAPAPGALTSDVSTHNLTGVGFQPDTTLVQLTPVNYLCRGATIRADLIRDGNPQSPDNYCFPAREVLKGQRRVIMTVPAMMDTLLIIVEGHVNLRDAIRVTASGSDIGESMTPLHTQGRTAWLWSIDTPADAESNLLKIVASFGFGCRIHTMVALKGGVKQWFDTMASRSWDGLVEEGPLSSAGLANLRWINSSVRSSSVETQHRQRGGRI